MTYTHRHPPWQRIRSMAPTPDAADCWFIARARSIAVHSRRHSRRWIHTDTIHARGGYRRILVSAFTSRAPALGFRMLAYDELVVLCRLCCACQYISPRTYVCY